MNIAISGATGFVGTAAADFFTQAGHRVLRITRRAEAADDIHWDPARGEIDAAKLDGADAVIHLAGENIADGRWTAKRKDRILKSRTQGTTLLCETLAKLPHPPQRLISASAVGYYGDRGGEKLTEESPAGDDFLADVCGQWEQATRPAADAGIPVVCARFGVVLSYRGGMLERMAMPFRWGLGVMLGDGRHYMSWVALDDVLAALKFLLENKAISGAVNVTAPEPVTNREFTRALAAAFGRRALLRAPAILLKTALGEMADMLLASQRAIPQKLLDAGFQFQHGTLQSALRPD